MKETSTPIPGTNAALHERVDGASYESWVDDPDAPPAPTLVVTDVDTTTRSITVTGFDKYVDGKMQDPEFAREYAKAATELTAEAEKLGLYEDPKVATAKALLSPLEKLVKDWVEVPLGTTGSLQVGEQAYLHPAQIELLKEKVAKAIVRARGPTAAPADCHKCAATFTSYKARREHLRGHLGE